MRCVPIICATVACLMLTACGKTDPTDGSKVGLKTSSATEISADGVDQATSSRKSNSQAVAANAVNKLSPPSIVAAPEGERLIFLRSFAPELLDQYSLQDMLKKYSDADPRKITTNADGSQELIWGDNLVSHHATFYRDRLLGYRWKVFRGSQADAEAEMKRPIATLGPPASTAVPTGEFDAVAWHQWLVEGYMVNTVVRRGGTIDGIPVYYAERSVINWTRVNQIVNGK
jgi:hypothetical protein